MQTKRIPKTKKNAAVYETVEQNQKIFSKPTSATTKKSRTIFAQHNAYHEPINREKVNSSWYNNKFSSKCNIMIGFHSYFTYTYKYMKSREKYPFPTTMWVIQLAQLKFVQVKNQLPFMSYALVNDLVTFNCAVEWWKNLHPLDLNWFELVCMDSGNIFHKQSRKKTELVKRCEL